MVLACATYDGFLFPPMEPFLTHLKTKNFQGRIAGLMENGMWAPMANKLMTAELAGMKNITVCEHTVSIRGAAPPLRRRPDGRPGQRGRGRGKKYISVHEKSAGASASAFFLSRYCRSSRMSGQRACSWRSASKQQSK